MPAMSKAYVVLMIAVMTAYSGALWGYVEADKINLSSNDSINGFASESFTPLLSGHYSPKQLAEKYRLKALEAFAQANFRQSLDDLNKAIAIDKNNALLYETRASVYEYLGENKNALLDIHLALKLDPTDFHPYMTRANMYYYEGEYKKALRDYETFLTVYNDNLYRMLWYYQTAIRLKHDNVDDSLGNSLDNSADGKFKQYIRDIDISTWPGPIVKLYLKQLTPAGVLKILANNNVTEPGVLCEAYFYLGQYYLMNNKQDAALAYFKQARETNAKAYIEYLYAGKELRRLQK